MSTVLLILISLVAAGPLQQSLSVEQRYSVPEWVTRVLEQSNFEKSYELDAHLNPFCHRADFDGDGKLDFVVFIRERSSGKIGLAFVHQGSEMLYIVGAGKSGAHGDEYSWIDAWTVFDK